MKKFFITFMMTFISLSIISCFNKPHVHSFEYIQFEETHFKQFTCGCPSPEIVEAHIDTVH